MVLQHWFHLVPFPASYHKVEGAEAHLGYLQTVGGESELLSGVQPGSNAAHGIHHATLQDYLSAQFSFSFVEVEDLGSYSADPVPVRCGCSWHDGGERWPNIRVLVHLENTTIEGCCIWEANCMLNVLTLCYERPELVPRNT